MDSTNTFPIALAVNELQSLLNIFTQASTSDENGNTLKSKIISGEFKVNKSLKYTNQCLKFKEESVNSGKPKSDLKGKDLHEYLKRLIIRIERKVEYPNHSETNLDKIISFLITNGEHVISFSRRTLFYHYCKYGYELQRLFKIHQEKSKKKEIHITFDNFIEQKLNISGRYARKLRVVGQIWYKYKKLENLAISFDEFYKRRNDIETLMENAYFKTYWSNDNKNDNNNKDNNKDDNRQR